jgi:galactose mutarotase-like enzyme
MSLDPNQWTRSLIDQHSVDLRQFVDFRQSTLPNGMRIIDAYNSSGLTFTLLPDRGLDIWTAHYKGLPLTWLSQGSPHPPDWGQAWLRQFNGGLLTTCGLTHVGPPETDAVTGEQRGIHGNYSRLRAEQVSVNTQWLTPETSGCHLQLSAIIAEASLFGAQLRLQRTITLPLAQPEVHIRDHIVNRGDAPVPLMVLYHVNLGFPLISAGAQVMTPHAQGGVYARDAAAKAGMATWAAYEAASAGYPEQVFFHHLCQQDGYTQILLRNGDLGFQLRWHTDALPYFTQWKNTRHGIYVCGLEPGNCIPEGQNAARQQGRLRWLAPGEAVDHTYSLSVIDGQAALQAATAQIAALQRAGTPIAACQLVDDV